MATVVGYVFLRPIDNPASVVEEFYNEWVSYEGNPVADRIYRDHDKISLELEERFDELIDSFGKVAYDPVLCAQDKPVSMNFEQDKKKYNDAIVKVRETFNGEKIITTVLLSKRAGSWLIDDIQCPGLAGDADKVEQGTVNFEDKLEKYVMENISVLSPVDPVLGGNFYVTGIDIISDEQAVVAYEDGHVAFLALMEYGKSEDDLPIIKGTIALARNLFLDEKPDFNEYGNLAILNDSWSLVYEEPGEPALSKTLEFDEESICASSTIASGLGTKCSLDELDVGKRVQIIGQKFDGQYVSVIYLLYL